MVHRSQKEEVTHARVKHQLEEHGKPDLHVDKVKDTPISVLREQQVSIGKVHANHGDQECTVTDYVVNLSTSGRGRERAKGVHETI